MRLRCGRWGWPGVEGGAIAIDGTIYQDAYSAKLAPESEIYLIPKIGGG